MSKYTGLFKDEASLDLFREGDQGKLIDENNGLEMKCVGGKPAPAQQVYSFQLNKNGTAYRRCKMISEGQSGEVHVEFLDDASKATVKYNQLRRAEKAAFDAQWLVTEGPGVDLEEIKARFKFFCVAVFNRVLSIYIEWFHGAHERNERTEAQHPSQEASEGSALLVMQKEKAHKPADHLLIVAATKAVISDRLKHEAMEMEKKESNNDDESTKKLAALRELQQVFSTRSSPQNKMDKLRQNIKTQLSKAKDDMCSTKKEKFLSVNNTCKVSSNEHSVGKSCLDA